MIRSLLTNQSRIVFASIFLTSTIIVLIIFTLPTRANTDSGDSTNSINAVEIVVVELESPMETTESGDTAQFTVNLGDAPTDTVTVALSSSVPTEGTVTSPASPLTFTVGNYANPQTVTVTGQPDDIDDSNQAYDIILDPASTGDANYDALENVPVGITNIDDDTAGLTVVETSPPLETTESGGIAGFTVVLDSEPTATITVSLSSDTPTEGTVTSPAGPLTFTTGNWNSAQPVTVTGQPDDLVDGDIGYNIILNPSGDAAYNALSNVLVPVTNLDDDVIGITVVETTPMVTTESGGTAGFTVALSSQPAAEVIVTLSSDDATEGAVFSPAGPLSFTTTNWNTPKPVTVLGQDDDIVDGDILYNIVLDPSSTGDAAYNSLASVNVPVTNNDEDEIGFTISPTSGLLTSESGIPVATFDVSLNTIPTADVTLTLSSSDTTEGTIDKSSLTFTTVNWNTIQTVTITGVDDFAQDGDQLYTIDTGPVTTTDLDYGVLLPADIVDVSVTNSDDDTAGYTVTPISDLWTSEGQKTEIIQILLKSRPTAPVTLSAVSSDPSEGIVAIDNQLIDPAIWPQTSPTIITLTGVDDCNNNGDETYTVTISATSDDPDYNGPVGSPLFVTNYDAPTIGWVQPVGDEEIYYSDGFSPINLEVENLCNEPISIVRYYRWVTALNSHLTIGEDIYPYQEVLDPRNLEPGWNQIFATGLGPPGPYQTQSIHKRILIRLDYDPEIFIPLMFKTP